MFLKRQRLVMVGVAIVAAGTCAGIALAWSGGKGSGYTVVGPFVNPDQADVTTCGANSPVWARGRASNTYKVFPRRPDGTYLVHAEFRGQYRTVAGQSVGACNNGMPDNGNTVGEGIKVQVSDTAVFVIRNGTFDPNATCVSGNPACFTFRFTRSFFGPSASFEIVSEAAIYETRCNGSWSGAGPGQATQQAGDIVGERNDCDDDD